MNNNQVILIVGNEATPITLPKTFQEFKQYVAQKTHSTTSKIMYKDAEDIFEIENESDYIEFSEISSRVYHIVIGDSIAAFE